MKINIDVEKIARKHIPSNTKPIEELLQTMVDDGNEFAPMDQGTLQDSTFISANSPTTGQYGWKTPYARFLHEGKVMVGVDSGSARANSDEKKKVTDADLQYSKDKNPNAQSHWVDVSEKKNRSKWAKMWKKLIRR